MKKDNLIALYAVYESEWEHRDNLFWSIFFKLFFSTLIVNLVPFVYPYFDKIVPPVIFPIIGIMMDFIFLYILLVIKKRHEAIGNTLVKIGDMLGDNYKREENIGFWKKRLLSSIIYISFVFFMVISITVLIVLLY